MKTVLVVDDAKNIRELLTTCLEIEGYKVVQAKDGIRALELLEAGGFDLMFLDVKMPQISGSEVLRRMKEKNIPTPVIVMTAFATVKNAIECTRLGIVAYLQKPFTVEKIKSVLNEVKLQETGAPDEKGIESILQEAGELIERKQYREATLLLKKALAAEPTHSQIYYLLSRAYEGEGDMKNAERFLKSSRLFE